MIPHSIDASLSPSLFSSCGDIMFSGHTAGMVVCILIWTHYSKGEEFAYCCVKDAEIDHSHTSSSSSWSIRSWIFPALDVVGDPATCTLTTILAWAIGFTGFFFIIATHFHYSNVRYEKRRGRGRVCNRKKMSTGCWR